MTKKILSIFAIVCLSVMIAPSVFAACSGTDNAAPTGCIAPATCENTGSVAAPNYTCKTVCGVPAVGINGYCSVSTESCKNIGSVAAPNYVCRPTTGSSAGGFTPPGPGECIKINSTFTVKLQQGNTKIDKTFNSGIFVAADGITKCPLLSPPAVIDNACNINTTANSASCFLPSNQIGVVAMLNVIYTVTNWIFYILTLLAILFIIYGGFTVLTSAGDPTKSTKGKNILTYAIIGLAVALLAKFVPSLVKFILNV